MGFYLVPYCQPSPPTWFLPITAIVMCHFLLVHHFGMACLAWSKVNIQQYICMNIIIQISLIPLFTKLSDFFFPHCWPLCTSVLFSIPRFSILAPNHSTISSYHHCDLSSVHFRSVRYYSLTKQIHQLSVILVNVSGPVELLLSISCNHVFYDTLLLNQFRCVHTIIFLAWIFP